MAQPTAPVDPTHQAGGGAAPKAQRHVNDLNENVLLHLRRVYESLSGPEKHWNQQKIHDFFHTTQKADMPEDLKTKDQLDLSGFLNYMTGADAAVTLKSPPEDLSWPLASYYISSSHNTYLSGNQLSSDSTTDTYRNVLLRGCRCVEIDVWDGDDSDSESDSSLSSSDEEGGERATQPQTNKHKKEDSESQSKRQSMLGRLQQRLPRSLTEKLDKTKLGTKLDEKVGEQEGKARAKTKKPPVSPHGRSSDQPRVVEPRVLHGYTLTKDIPFRDVCIAIRDNGFTTSDLPVIVSLEVHCNPQQQAIMVGIMKEAWKDLLVDHPAHIPGELPAPETLKRKILIKVKHAPAESSTQDVPPSEDEDEAEEEAAAAAAQQAGSTKESATVARQKQKKPSKIIHELSRMGVYTNAVSFKSFTQPEASMPTHIFSLSEKKYMDYHHGGKSRGELIKHNRHYMMRAYPAGFRVSSSNLNPAAFWATGTQIVALNWQQTDEGMMLNEGMFAGTGGYVLKPPGYRPDRPAVAAPNTIMPKALSLAITFLAAQSIPLPPDETTAKGFKPYIKAEIHVDGSDFDDDSDGSGSMTPATRNSSSNNEGHEKEGEYKVRTRTHKGCDVDLLGERLPFPRIPGLVEELTFLRFTVRDNEIGKDDLAAWACVRLDRLGCGYRFVPLVDMKGNLTDGVILVKVEKQFD